MFSATITQENGTTYDLTADSRDVVEWELADRKRYLGQLQERTSMVAVGELLYFAARRQGLYDGTAREFVRTNVIDLLPPDADGAGPTAAAR